MVRCFEDDNVIHVNNKVDPVDDSDVINFELALSDVGQIERRIDRLSKKARLKDDQVAQDVCPPLAICMLRTASPGTWSLGPTQHMLRRLCWLHPCPLLFAWPAESGCISQCLGWTL